ncbi:MAG: hypothetical protein F6J87_26625 [Spirulina sp. SIO3F2]|nr:hypothetical protein [Spirulina sp. SIO3F2]
MSYWAWLARMVFFSVLGGASLLFWFRTTPSEPQSQEESFLMPQAQVVPFEGHPLTRANSNYQPVRGKLPPVPKSRLAPLQTYEAYSASLPDAASQSTQSSPSSQTNRATSRSQLSQTATSPTQSAQSRSAHSSPSATTPPRPSQPSAPPFNLAASLSRYAGLFENPISLGMLAIGVAEGNYRVFVESSTLYVEQTSLYFGHTDPGNLSWGERVTNYGPCSDQGRSDGDISVAEQMCLQRSRDRLPTNLQDLADAGINPNSDVEAVINTADLYNQASPVHSRLFPQALQMAYQGGLTGVEAMAWARTASFYVDSNKRLDLQNGRNVASGLLGICARERRAVTEWECVYADQLRRAKAVASVLDKYFEVYAPRS